MQTGSDEDAITGINVTPLVDVCLVLVIIFMVTAPILSDPAFQVNLPKTVTQEGEEGKQVVVSIAPDGKVAIDNKEFESAEDFAATLRAHIQLSPDKIVVFRADKDARYGVLVDLMNEAKNLGAKVMTVASEKKKEQAP